ncbi:GTPase domain-containing protein [Methylotuvimicrobium sp. KM2]|uniref:GTP-binding protein n=1 Tax=Methylotuvimicrobium sp. KM2 TaxID=3133976 RepID=UPI003101AE2C
MAQYDESSQKLTIKLVYYGPALSGKTTNLMRLHDILTPDMKGELMIMETADDRTLFFDLLPLGFRAPSGLLIKFKVYTVPGQVIHDSTRKAVLSRADGVVFVADSQRTQSVNNGESFENLAANAARVGLDFQQLPLVVQFNKRDLPAILSEQEIMARWEKAPWPVLFSSALTGEGIIETFRALLAAVYRTCDRLYRLQSDHGLDCDSFIAQTLGGSLSSARG